MADRDKETGSLESLLRASFEIFDPHAGDFVLRDVEHFGDDGVPDRLDLLVHEGARGHDFRGAQGVAAMHQVNSRSEAGQISGFFAR